MAIEEITLSAPAEPGLTAPAARTGEPADEQPTNESADLAQLARKFLKAAKARDRWALTERGRQRRQERFNQALKTVVKSMATEASRLVPDRPARLDLRTRVYSTMMVLAKAVSEDQLGMIRRSRRVLRFGLACTALGLLGIGFTLVANGWVTLPPL